MRCIVKIQRCGNGTHVAIPKSALDWLGWLPGEIIVFELLESHQLRYRKPERDEFAPKGMKPVALDKSLPMPR